MGFKAPSPPTRDPVAEVFVAAERKAWRPRGNSVASAATSRGSLSPGVFVDAEEVNGLRSFRNSKADRSGRVVNDPRNVFVCKAEKYIYERMSNG